MQLLKDIQASYFDGAKPTRKSAEIRIGMGGFEDVAAPDRAEMTSIARWMHENIGTIGNIDNSIINNSLGLGMKLRSLTTSETVAAEIERKYNLRMNNKDLYDIKGINTGIDAERILMGARMTDGDVIANYVHTNDKYNPLKLQFIESSNFDVTVYDDNIYSGVEVDSYGKPKTYHLYNSALNKQYQLSTEDAILYQKIDNRFSQYRGMSEYRYIISNIRHIHRWQNALLAGAEARASLPYYVSTDNPAGLAAKHRKDANAVANDKLLEINGLSVHYMNKGEELKQLNPSVAGDNYKDFFISVIRQIAVGRKISYELAFRDYSDVNFASSKASLLQDHKTFDYEQLLHVSYFKNPDFEKWLTAMVMSGNMQSIKPSHYLNNKEEYLKKSWIPPAREWVDPLKDIISIKEELALGLTTLTREAGKKGRDIDQLIEETKQEQEKFEKAGLDYPQISDNAAATLALMESNV